MSGYEEFQKIMADIEYFKKYGHNKDKDENPIFNDIFGDVFDRFRK